MFGINKIGVWALVMAVAIVVCLPSDALAAFDNLKESGRSIFLGLKAIIYPGAAVGIICVCIGGFFWKYQL